MELDELKVRWQEQDRKLDECIRLNQRVLRESVLGKADTVLRRLSRLLWFELVANLVGPILLGSFIGNHFTEPRFLIPAAVLQLGAVALVIASVRQLAAIAGMDYGAPIIAIQKELESLRVARIRALMWTLILSPLAWIPLLIVALKGLFDVDVYATFDRNWLVANVLFGVAVVGVAVWISRSYGDRMSAWPVVQRLLREIGGQNLAAAEAYVESLSRFADDSSAELA